MVTWRIFYILTTSQINNKLFFSVWWTQQNFCTKPYTMLTTLCTKSFRPLCILMLKYRIYIIFDLYILRFVLEKWYRTPKNHSQKLCSLNFSINQKYRLNLAKTHIKDEFIFYNKMWDLDQNLMIIGTWERVHVPENSRFTGWKTMARVELKMR